MNLAQTLDHLRREALRHAGTFSAARARRAALAPHATSRDVLEALAPSSPLTTLERNAIVVALLEEHQATRHPLWGSLLACAFGGMLGRLRRRVGNPRDEDLDQRVLGAFLEAARSVRPIPYVLLALRRATEESLFRVLRSERTPETLSFDEERHAADPFGAEAKAKVAAEEIVRAMAERADAALFDAMVATYVHEETLHEHVAHALPAATDAQRKSAYQRLWLARAALTRDLRERLRSARAA